MSLIEQATKRLEELRRAGIEVPPMVAGHSPAEIGLREGRSEELRPNAGAAVVSFKQSDSAPIGAPHRDRDRPGADASRTSRLVEIDLGRLAEQGYLTPDSARGPLADEIRIIKMQIIRGLESASAKQRRANVIVVTSAVSGEGKTFFATNLAMSVAMEVDLHALLVDADVLRPAIESRYGISPGPGLLDLLTQPTLAVSDVMLRTNVPKLAFISAGTAHPNAAELLAGHAADRLLTDLAAPFPDRLVIVDAPPLLAASEARQLAARAGHVIMVVEADRTDARLVSQAFAAVADCPMVSSVLNRVPASLTTSSYSYYGV